MGLIDKHANLRRKVPGELQSQTLSCLLHDVKLPESLSTVCVCVESLVSPAATIKKSFRQSFDKSGVIKSLWDQKHSPMEFLCLHMWNPEQCQRMRPDHAKRQGSTAGISFRMNCVRLYSVAHVAAFSPT